MKLSELKELEKLKREKEDLERRIQKIKPSVISKDSVQASSTEFPYTQFTAKIEGYEYPYQKIKLEKNLEKKKYKIAKKIKQIEYELNSVDDSEVRQIIRYIVYDSMTYIQIEHKMNENLKKNQRPYSENSLRMKVNRYFEKK